jgi:hypothetical protein
MGALPLVWGIPRGEGGLASIPTPPFYWSYLLSYMYFYLYWFYLMLVFPYLVCISVLWGPLPSN